MFQEFQVLMKSMAKQSPPKTLRKRLHAYNDDSSSNFKRPKPCAVRDFPRNCGPSQPNNVANSPVELGHTVSRSSPSRIKHEKVEFVGDFTEECGASASETEEFEDMEKTMVLEGELKLPGEEDKVCSIKGKGQSAVEKLAEIFALAREFIALLDGKSSYFEILTDVSVSSEAKPLIETVKTEEKRARDMTLSEPVGEQISGEDVSENGGKDVSRSLEKVQEDKITGLEMKLEDVEDVNILSPEEVELLGPCFRNSVDETELMVKPETKPEKSSGFKFSGDGIGSKGNEIVGLAGEHSHGTVFDHGNGGISISEIYGKNCREDCVEPENVNLDECGSSREEVDKFMESFATGENLAIVEYGDKGMNDCRNQDELVNLCIVKQDGSERFKVKEALKVFEERYIELLGRKEQTVDKGKGKRYAYLEAADILKSEGMWITDQKPFGHIPGIEIGDAFRFRAELAVAGLHCAYISGIDYVVLGNKKFATSVVNSGRYENESKDHDSLIYSGHGGNPKISDKSFDQRLEKGNLALMNSMKMGYPVRVIYKRARKLAANIIGLCNDAGYVYVYDGLYRVAKFWQERDQNGCLVFKYELIRMLGQPRAHKTVAKSRKLLPCKEVCMINDISKGKEHHRIRVMNGIDDERPPPFTYITRIIYPVRHQIMETIGCNCIDGCSESEPCPCVVRNGGEIPFNEKGAIVRAKPIVFECGPNCNCPPTCMNRVTQHGPRYQLEIFKTKSKGWGIRSKNYIASGSFICEYIGELIGDKEAEQRIGNDEYLFDIGDCHNEYGEFDGFLDSKNDDAFAIDAFNFGNIGRYVNHSCCPNMYGQEVLYDHNDKRMPHIMFFAAKNIPALQELTYDYNYKIGRVCDANGNIKVKHCYCGSHKCNGRMY